MYSETRSKGPAFHRLKQSGTYEVEITDKDLQDAKYESPLIEKFIEANARTDAIKQINIALSMIGDVRSEEYQRLIRVKEVYEKLDDADFMKYVYNESSPKRIEMYVTTIYGGMNGKMSARQCALMYLAGIDALYSDVSREHRDRLDKAIALLSELSDHEYINLSMDLMDSTYTAVSALGKLLNDRGVDMIKEAKEND